MTIKILNEIQEMPGYVRCEENHQISIRKKDNLEKFNTPCGFEFDEESYYGCRTCDNLEYCKGRSEK